MPYENDMPADEMYGDGSDASPKAEAKPEYSKDESRGEDMEATLPIGILQGKEFNVGDEVVLKITAMHDDSLQVAYAPAKGKDEEKPAGDEKAAVPASMGGGDSDYA